MCVAHMSRHQGYMAIWATARPANPTLMPPSKIDEAATSIHGASDRDCLSGQCVILHGPRMRRGHRLAPKTDTFRVETQRAQALHCILCLLARQLRSFLFHEDPFQVLPQHGVHVGLAEVSGHMLRRELRATAHARGSHEALLTRGTHCVVARRAT